MKRDMEKEKSVPLSGRKMQNMGETGCITLGNGISKHVSE